MYGHNSTEKFIPNLAKTINPLSSLLKKKSNVRIWRQKQQESFNKRKQVLSSNSGLAMYEGENPTLVSSYKSAYGLGEALFQKQNDGNFKPIRCASRSLSNTERRYSQIEKET